MLSIPFLWWYLNVLPVQTEGVLATISSEISVAKCLLYLSIPIMLISIIFIIINENVIIQKIIAFTLLFVGIIYTGSFEWIRESSRQPYLISNHTYSNSILVDDIARINNNGISKNAKWVKNRQISERNVVEAGREIFKIQCLSCHTVGGPVNDVLNHTEILDLYGLDSQISGQEKLRKYMPEFFGTEIERMALSRFIIEKLHKKNFSSVVKLKTKKISIHPFDKTKDQYLLIGAAQYGISEVQEHEQKWSMESPSNVIYAQLILRGKIPKIISENVVVTYSIGKHREKMVFSEELSAFYANQVQAILDSSLTICDPYPLVIVTTTDTSSECILAQSQFVVPTSREIGCKNCHGGNWRYDNRNGISSHTAENILKVHDKISNLAIGLLKEDLKQGKPSAKVLIKQIEKNNNNGSDSVAPRKPWVNLPDCLSCHSNFEAPETDEHPVNNWIKSENSLFRRQADESGIMCISCHGSPHALYPSVNPYNENLDNISVIQYQGNAAPMGSAENCTVCHTVDMTESIHHFGNQRE